MSEKFFRQTWSVAVDDETTSEIELADGLLYTLEVGASTNFSAAGNLKMAVGQVSGGTFFTWGYPNNPNTATSGFNAWEVPEDASGMAVACEPAQFGKFAKLVLPSTATVAADYTLVGRVIY